MTVWMLLVEPGFDRANPSPAGDVATIPRGRDAALLAAGLRDGLSARGAAALADGPAGPARGHQRDFDYLPGSPTTPLHLVNYVAPGLFHRSPLWRPLVWDPFHTSPEEQLAYVGLVPLFLALLAVVRETPSRSGRSRPGGPGRVDAAAEPWAVRARVSSADRAAGLLVLPAPARWGAGDVAGAGDPGGQGARRLADWPRSRPFARRACDRCRLSGSACVLVARRAGALARRLGSRHAAVSAAVSAGIRRPGPGPTIRTSWRCRPGAEAGNRLSGSRRIETGGRCEQDRRSSELRGTPVRDLPRRAGRDGRSPGCDRGSCARRGDAEGRSACRPAWSILTVARPVLLGRHRLVDSARSGRWPSRARSWPGWRVSPGRRGASTRLAQPADGRRRWRRSRPTGRSTCRRSSRSTVAGSQARSVRGAEREPVRKAMRAAGVGVRVLDPIEVAMEQRVRTRALPVGASPEAIADPALAGWLFGSSWVAEQRAVVVAFSRLEPEPEPHAAWFVPLTAVARPAMLDDVDRATPGPSSSSSTGPAAADWSDARAERLEVIVETGDGPAGSSSASSPTRSGRPAGSAATAERASPRRSCRPSGTRPGEAAGSGC